MPKKIEAVAEEASLYAKMLNQEKKLDTVLMRKRAEIQDAIRRPCKVDRCGVCASRC